MDRFAKISVLITGEKKADARDMLIESPNPQ